MKDKKTFTLQEISNELCKAQNDNIDEELLIDRYNQTSKKFGEFIKISELEKWLEKIKVNGCYQFNEEAAEFIKQLLSDKSKKNTITKIRQKQMNEIPLDELEWFYKGMMSVFDGIEGGEKTEIENELGVFLDIFIRRKQRINEDFMAKVNKEAKKATREKSSEYLYKMDIHTFMKHWKRDIESAIMEENKKYDTIFKMMNNIRYKETVEIVDKLSDNEISAIESGKNTLASYLLGSVELCDNDPEYKHLYEEVEKIVENQEKADSETSKKPGKPEFLIKKYKKGKKIREKQKEMNKIKERKFQEILRKDGISQYDNIKEMEKELEETVGSYFLDSEEVYQMALKEYLDENNNPNKKR